MGENICRWNNWQMINLPNKQKVHVAQYKKQTTQSTNGQNT